jgi:DNA methylase
VRHTSLKATTGCLLASEEWRLSTSHQSLPVSLHNIINRHISIDSSAVEELVLNLRGKDWQNLRDKDREQLVEICFRYWRTRDFPYHTLSDAEINREYLRLAAVDKDQVLLCGEIQTSTVGLKIANYFHPQMWSVRTRGRRSPVQCFNSDRLLRRLIRTAFQVSPERRSVNENNLRGMLRTFSRTGRVSNFRPTAAKAIYETYSRDGDCVLDFSSGYGGRLLGCLPLNRRYIGIDPCREQVKGLRRMIARLKRLVKVEASATIYRACAEDFLPQLESNSIPLIFSSPPYFDTEKYSHEPTQSFIKYPEYDDWLENFVGTVIAESSRILKTRGYFILNVADISGYNLIRDVQRLASPYFKLAKTLKLRMGQLPYFRQPTEANYRVEPILVFTKKHTR